MTVNFVPRDQRLGNDEALQQHKRTTVAHAFDCAACDRHFNSGAALLQHRRDLPAHAPSFNCETCNRSFGSEEALGQHIRDSPIHAASFNCETCNRSFSSEEALGQHIRDSPIHAQSFNCETCNRSFSSEEALGQHIRDSPIHAPSFNCKTCDRSFSSEEALEQHLRSSRIHQKPPETPLDVFFVSFRTFEYDPSQSPAKSYARLREHEGWRRGDNESNNAWNRYQDALASELRMWYGAENSLTAWHALCRAVGVEPLPQTCKRCEEAIRKTHINIVDLIEWGRRRGSTDERVRTFRNVAELRAYTKDTGKVFRNTFDQEDGNVVLRHLLRDIFRESL